MAETLASDVAIARLIQKLRGNKNRSTVSSDETTEASENTETAQQAVDQREDHAPNAQ